MYKKLSILLLLLLMFGALFGANIEKEVIEYTVQEGEPLQMSLYRNKDITSNQPQPCLIFVFGGGFKEGDRDAETYIPYFNYFAERGFTVATIDYRLGMKGKKAPSVFSFKPLLNSIYLAVEDLYNATSYLLDEAEKLHIDPSRIIISGSSAGAITVLQADYMKQNNHSLAKDLPESFRYAGVISFAGGIFSKEGLPSYKKKPAPTLFFHGAADRLVPYNKTGLFHLGMFGSKQLVKRFRQERYPYTFFSIEEVGHEIAELPMKEYLAEIEQFMNDLVFDRKQWMIEVHHRDLLKQSDNTTTPANYYN